MQSPVAWSVEMRNRILQCVAEHAAASHHRMMTSACHACYQWNHHRMMTSACHACYQWSHHRMMTSVCHVCYQWNHRRMMMISTLTASVCHQYACCQWTAILRALATQWSDWRLARCWSHCPVHMECQTHIPTTQHVNHHITSNNAIFPYSDINYLHDIQQLVKVIWQKATLPNAWIIQLFAAWKRSV